MRRRFLLAFVGLALLVTRPGHAQSGSRAELSDQLFREATAAWEQGAFEQACSKFEDSQRLDPAPGTSINLSRCEERKGRLLRARTHCVSTRDNAPSKDASIRAAAQRCIEGLDARIPRLTVMTPHEPRTELRIRLDGRELSLQELGGPAPVDPGEHVIEVWEYGNRTVRTSLTLHELERVTYVVPASRAATLKTAASATPPSPAVSVSSAVSSKSSHSSSYVPYAIGGFGLACLATSAAATVLMLRDKRTMDERCPAGQCDRQGYDASMSGKRWGNVATVTFVAGLGSVGISAYWLATLPISISQQGTGAMVSLAGKFY